MATSKTYVLEETAHTWSDAVTGGDDTLDLGGLATLGVRQGDQWDRGASAVPFWYEWRLIIDGFDTAPVVGERVNAYLGFSDGTNHDGDLGTADAAATTVALPNLMFIGSATVQTVTAANELIVSGDVLIIARYVTPVIENKTVDSFLSTSDAHKFILTPHSPQGQAT